ncbi:MAG: serine hydrolase domain-containing protein [bacterium]
MRTLVIVLAAVLAAAEGGEIRYGPGVPNESFAPGWRAPGPACPPGDTAWLDSVLTFAMDSYPIPGMATMAIRGDSILWSRCYGYAVLEESIPVTDTSCFSLASISKTVAGTAAMQLWEDGYFDLGGDVNESLPFMVRHSHFPDSLIDYRMLMTHTSALRDNFRVIDSLHLPGDPTVSLRDFTEGYLVPGGAYYDSIFNFCRWAPGRQFEYSNIGITLLGYVVEAMADSFPLYTRDHIFRPLGMDRTTWFFGDLDTMSVACQYYWNGDEYVRIGYNSSTILPAAGLKSCTRDFVRFLTAYVRDGAYDTVRILDSATVALMTSTQFPPNAGFCWFTTELVGDSIWYHSGTWDGICTCMGFCRELRTGFIVFTNGHWPQVAPAVFGIVVPALHEFARSASAVSEARVPVPGARNRSLVRGVLELRGPVGAILLDISGRKVANLVPGPNEIRHLAPGVYFLREHSAFSVTKVVVTR